MVEVNGMVAKGRKPEDLIKELAGFRGPLTFKLIPGEGDADATEENVRNPFFGLIGSNAFQVLHRLQLVLC